MKRNEIHKPLFCDDMQANRTLVAINSNFNNYCVCLNDIFAKNGIKMTSAIFEECLSIKKIDKKTNVLQGDEKRNASSGKVNVIYETEIGYSDCPSIDAVFIAMKEEIANRENITERERRRLIEDIENDAEKLKSDIYDCINVGLSVPNEQLLKQYVVIDNGKLVLPNDINERIKNDYSYFMDNATNKANDLMKLHNKIADDLTKLVSMVCRGAQDEIILDIGSIFDANVETMTVSAAPLRYNEIVL